MLRTFAVLAFGVALIAWGTNYMASQGSASRSDMVEDLVDGMRDAIDDVLPDGDEAPVVSTVAPQLTITGTNGSGVSLRDDCTDESRIDGALAEGATVTLVADGEDRCLGWSLVRQPSVDEDLETWVRNEFLAPPTLEQP